MGGEPFAVCRGLAPPNESRALLAHIDASIRTVAMIAAARDMVFAAQPLGYADYWGRIDRVYLRATLLLIFGSLMTCVVPSGISTTIC